MNEQMVRDLSVQVQRNCHISDARHGGDYAMCTYLMKMREYFRWEKGLPFGVPLPREEVGNWLAERERLWESLEDDDYAPLLIDGQTVEPFNADTANACLAPQGLVYSAGLGRNAKPHFFLGELRLQRQPGTYAVLISDREFARDLAAPPAMTQGSTIYVRRESLRRLLWERLESWRWNRPDNALGRAFACYDFDTDLAGALDAMTDLEIETALLHEMGEFQAGERLGEAWNERLLEWLGTPAEWMARAVRDHLADCLVTLPALAESGEVASVHFYLGNLTHMRREIFPSLETAYRAWRADGSRLPLVRMARRGQVHWEQVARSILAVRQGPGAADEVATLVKNAYL